MYEPQEQDAVITRVALARMAILSDEPKDVRDRASVLAGLIENEKAEIKPVIEYDFFPPNHFMAAVAAFKEAWEAADAEGQVGRRVEAGILAMMQLGWRFPTEEGLDTAIAYGEEMVALQAAMDELQVAVSNRNFGTAGNDRLAYVETPLWQAFSARRDEIRADLLKISDALAARDLKSEPEPAPKPVFDEKYTRGLSLERYVNRFEAGAQSLNKFPNQDLDERMSHYVFKDKAECDAWLDGNTYLDIDEMLVSRVLES